MCWGEAAPKPSESDAGVCPPGGAAHECPEKKKKVVTILWDTTDAWCGEKPTYSGTTQSYVDGETVSVSFEVLAAAAKIATTSHATSVSMEAFSRDWEIKDVLPAKAGAHFNAEAKVDAKAEAEVTPAPLKVHFIPTVAKKEYKQNRAHFDLSSSDYGILIESDIKYVKGWAAQVVKLGAAVPATTGGLLDGQLTWAGYRWMKRVGTKPQFYDGSAWKDLPAGFTLQDSNNFSVGFYKNGSKFTCQYGGDWPESFTDWDIDAAPKQAKITNWKNNIESTWTGKFDIKRKTCPSADKTCCRYATKAKVTFTKKDTFTAGLLIIADGNIRSNDSLFFLDEPRIAMAAHEFGHHIGNPDEYAGATLDTSLNSDGAVNGIDADSIMGQNLTKVKKRHYRTVCTHFAKMVKDEFGKTYEYEAVAP